jgi:antitoxin component of MazEF toxin-antitoxin module
MKDQEMTIGEALRRVLDRLEELEDSEAEQAEWEREMEASDLDGD